MKLALDTNRYTDLARGESSVVDLVTRASAILMPFIVISELRSGFRRGTGMR